MAKNTSRKLAAILAADVVGYSRLMGEDEAGTLDALRAHREELIEPKIAEHEGRIVKLMGDGLLAEFPSAVEAVHCAVEIQHTMGERNAKVPAERRIIYRIGINIGDIIVEGDDIYGDGVNVAARLEGLAEPSGICVSRTVFNHVKGKLDLTFEHLGEKEVKNIVEPVTVYRVVLDDKAAALVTPVVQEATKPVHRRWMVAAAAVFVAAVGGMLWWQPWAPDVEPASMEKMALRLPDKPSIVVLPFANLSGNADQDYFVDGFTSAINTHLSKFPQLFVIAGMTAFTYKGKPVRAREVGRELGVRYVLEGSVRRVADKLTVNAQLIEAESEQNVWADQYDFPPDDLFSVQSELIAEIVGTLRFAIEGEAVAAVLRRPAESLKAYDLYLKSLAVSKALTKDATGEGIALLEQAIAIEDDFLEAHYEISGLYLSLWRFGMANDPADALRLARVHAERALQIDERDYRGHYRLGTLYLFADHEHDLALAAFERALADNPNDANILYNMGFLRSLMGAAAEAISWNDKAKRLNPSYPGWYNFNAALSQFWVKDYERAMALAKSGIAVYPKVLAPRRILIATLVEMGRMDEARKEVADYLAIRPDFRLSTFRNTPFQNPADQDRYFNALRKAGLPD